jgi:Domain of unknown function (DUF4129)
MDTQPLVANDEGQEPRQNSTPSIATISIGEHLLPVAFAFMEACWIAALLIGLADIHFLGWDEPLIPVWAPFLILICVSWFSRTFMSTRSPERQQSNITILVCMQVLMTLIVVWASLFAGRIPLWNPEWILSLLQGILMLNITAFSMVGVVLLCYYFHYRGTVIANHSLEPTSVTRVMQLGGLLFLGVICVQAATGAQDIALILLIPLFLCSALFTRALAHVVFVRRHHLTGLHGSKPEQDRLLIMTMAPIFFLLISIAFIIGILADPTFLSRVQSFLSPLGLLYDGLASILSILGVLLAAPFFYLAKSLGFKFQPPKIPQTPRPAQRPPTQSQLPSPALHTMANIMTTLLIIAVIVTIFLLIRFALRRYRKMRVQQVEDIHESLWSWSLFWAKFKQGWLNLWQRFFHASKATAQIVIQDDLANESATLRDVRLIYRAFLRWSADHGYQRKYAETPYEFRQRLQQPLSVVEPEVRTMTEIYTAARYSQEPLAESEIAQMLQSWDALQQKAQPTPPQ